MEGSQELSLRTQFIFIRVQTCCKLSAESFSVIEHIIYNIIKLTYIVKVAFKRLVRLHKSSQVICKFQWFGHSWLQICETIFPLKVIAWRINIHTLIKITKLIHISFENTGRKFSSGIMHWKNYAVSICTFLMKINLLFNAQSSKFFNASRNLCECIWHLSEIPETCDRSNGCCNFKYFWLKTLMKSVDNEKGFDSKFQHNWIT